mmetsp:Transcript_1074/g.1772  ORF Transcript_1074/g.1772 Transcript_1074/m.1772 type:complete len:256 (-) Transcript_1074:7-774(-)
MLNEMVLLYLILAYFILCKSYKGTKMIRPSASRKFYHYKRVCTSSTCLDDPFESFSSFDNILFSRFSLAVSEEVEADYIPANFTSLIDMIKQLSFSGSPSTINDKSKSMLVRLFPSWLLPAYKVLFGPFKSFSALMNTWVTHFTTLWLMGPSEVVDLELEDGTVVENNCLVVEKCRFLETAGCVQTCLHACKIPTQRFFLEEMDLPVTLKPNFTDYSCRFEFGVLLTPLELDESVQVPCLTECTRQSVSSCGMCS